MLLKDFYSIEDRQIGADGKHTVSIRLNKDHEVFQGHFPGNPVTPGVCMIQIIKELSQDILQTSLFLKSASNVKFMALINPEKNPVLRLELEIIESNPSEVKVKNSTFFDTTTALKLTNIYEKI